MSAMEDIFLAIYQGNLWGSQESRSGPGSTLARAADVVPCLKDEFASSPCVLGPVATHLASAGLSDPTVV